MSGKRIRKPNRNNDFVYEPVRRNNRKRKSNIDTVHKQAEVVSNENDELVPKKTGYILENESSQPTIPEPSSSSNTTTPTSVENSDTGDSDEEVNNAINKIYTSFNSGAAFSAGIEKFIRQKRSLNMHKQRRKIFPRRRFVTHQPHDTMMADIVFYEGNKRANDNYKYILTGLGFHQV